jgi:hypothetical protein
MQKPSLKSYFLLAAIALFVFGCTNKKADQINPAPPPTGGQTNPGCDTTNVTFSGTIQPILQQNCAISGCHTSATRAGGYSYETYAGFMQVVQNGRVLGAINHTAGYVPMPENAPKLSDCAILKITHWIEIGAPNN